MIGMLWYDGDKKTSLVNKVETAVAYYRKKYGQEPDFCFANPEMLDTAEVDAGEIKVKARASVQANHLWIGRKN